MTQDTTPAQPIDGAPIPYETGNPKSKGKEEPIGPERFLTPEARSSEADGSE